MPEECTGAECSTSSSSNNAKYEPHKKTGELIDVKVVYNKNKYSVSTTTCTTVAEFKKQIYFLIGISDNKCQI